MDEAQLAASLARIATTQEHTANALASLAGQVEAARAEGIARGEQTAARLSELETLHATTAERLETHIAHVDQRIELLWRVWRWVLGLLFAGGGIVSSSKLASAFV